MCHWIWLQKKERKECELDREVLHEHVGLLPTLKQHIPSNRPASHAAIIAITPAPLPLQQTLLKSYPGVWACGRPGLGAVNV